MWQLRSRPPSGSPQLKTDTSIALGMTPPPGPAAKAGGRGGVWTARRGGWFRGDGRRGVAPRHAAGAPLVVLGAEFGISREATRRAVVRGFPPHPRLSVPA